MLAVMLFFVDVAGDEDTGSGAQDKVEVLVEVVIVEVDIFGDSRVG